MGKTIFIGKAKELQVAKFLVDQGLNVYFPLVDTGFTLTRSDAEKFPKAGAVLVFGEGDGRLEDFYFIPARSWKSKAEDKQREDGKIAVYLSQHQKWADTFRGEAGLQKAFGRLLPKA